jgi:hypothetical protein
MHVISSRSTRSRVAASTQGWWALALRQLGQLLGTRYRANPIRELKLGTAYLRPFGGDCPTEGAIIGSSQKQVSQVVHGVSSGCL